jgi:lipoyl(octanoyl) transferase
MIHIIDWGLIPYELAQTEQLKLVEAVQAHPKDEFIVFCSHPPVVTLGRATEKADMQGWGGEIFEVSRGGRATYHGPEQVVCYPILSLQSRKPDLHLYLRMLEESIIRSLVHYDLKAEGKKEDATGVWIGKQKIASIGVAAKKWVTYHGVAVNVNEDPLAFTGISPCGFTKSTMTSLQELTGKVVSKEEYKENLKEEMLAVFAQTSEWN